MHRCGGAFVSFSIMYIGYVSMYVLSRVTTLEQAATSTQPPRVGVLCSFDGFPTSRLGIHIDSSYDVWHGNCCRWEGGKHLTGDG